MVDDPEARVGDAPAAEAETAMHVHKPKPLHGFREVVGEVAIIVLGILIAIGLEQGVEQLRWSSEVRHAHVLLAEDMKQTDRVFANRLAARPCIDKRIDALDAVIEGVARHETVPHVARDFPDVGNGLFRAAWETSQASQTLTHFDEHELQLYGAYYVQVGNTQTFMGKETEAWDGLKVLGGDPSRLGATDIAGLRVAIQHVRFYNRIIAEIAGGQLSTAKALGQPIPEPAPKRLGEMCQPVVAVGAAPPA